MASESDAGLAFDADGIAATVILEEMEYAGVRLKTAAYLERTRIPVTIDVGFGDAVADATQRLDSPSLLDFPVSRVRSYPPAIVIAEKFQAMVALSVLNGRMKDCYDLWAIPRAIGDSDDELDGAIRATFRRRGTPIPVEPRPDCRPKLSPTKVSKGNGALNAGSLELQGVSPETIIKMALELAAPSCARIVANSDGKA